MLLARLNLIRIFRRQFDVSLTPWRLTAGQVVVARPSQCGVDDVMTDAWSLRLTLRRRGGRRGELRTCLFAYQHFIYIFWTSALNCRFHAKTIVEQLYRATLKRFTQPNRITPKAARRRARVFSRRFSFSIAQKPVQFQSFGSAPREGHRARVARSSDGQAAH